MILLKQFTSTPPVIHAKIPPETTAWAPPGICIEIPYEIISLIPPGSYEFIQKFF